MSWWWKQEGTKCTVFAFTMLWSFSWLLKMRQTPWSELQFFSSIGYSCLMLIIWNVRIRIKYIQDVMNFRLNSFRTDVLFLYFTFLFFFKWPTYQNRFYVSFKLHMELILNHSSFFLIKYILDHSGKIYLRKYMCMFLPEPW